MPSFDIIRKNTPKQSFRVKSVMGTFDLQTHNIEERFKGSFDLSNDWQIGVIVGNSGTGKTTIAKELFSAARSRQSPLSAARSRRPSSRHRHPA